MSRVVYAARPGLEYVKGLSLYAEGRVELAYPLLEAAFDQGEAKDPRKLDAAMVLAFAPNSVLKKHRRHFYASYCLGGGGSTFGSSGTSGMTQTSRSALLRIAGDGFFDEQEFATARHYYLSLVEAPDLRSTTYAQYRLGWIDLNEQRPDLASTRWFEVLKRNRAALQDHDSELLKSIIRDFGRALAEDSANNTPAVTLDLLPSVILENAQELAEGITLGLKRLSDQEAIETFRKLLSPTPYYGLVLAVLLEKGAVFRNFPCELPHWLADRDWSKLTSQKAFISYLNSCAKSVSESRTCDTAAGKSARAFFETLSLKDQELLPRISLSVSCKQWRLACRDLVDLALQTARAPDLSVRGASLLSASASAAVSLPTSLPVSLPVSLNEDSLLALFETCSQELPDPKQLEDLFEVYAEHNLLPKSPTSAKFEQAPLIQLFKVALMNDGFRHGWIKRMLNKPEIFLTTGLPELAAQALPPDEIEKWGDALLSALGESPISKSWLSVLDARVRSKIKEGQVTNAQQILSKYLPVDLKLVQDEARSGLWEYYWLGLNHDELSQDGYTVAFWLRELPMDHLSSSRSLRALALAMKFGELELIWSKWNGFEKALNLSTDLKGKFFDQSLALLERGQLSPFILKTSPAGRLLIRLGQADPSVKELEVAQYFPKGFHLLKDLKSLEKLKRFSQDLHRGRLELNGLLPKTLTRKLKALSQTEKLIAQTSWSRPGYNSYSKWMYWKDGMDLVKELEKVKTKALRNPELAGVSQQMTELSEKLRQQVASFAPTQVALIQKVQK